MSTHYLGTTKSGRLLSRKSTNPHFTHAAIHVGAPRDRIPSFSTSAAGALKNAGQWIGSEVEVAEVRKVSAAEYREARAAAK